MKKLLLSLLVSLGLIVALPLSASAAVAKTDITGSITFNGSSPVDGANVTVTCGSVSGVDVSGADGGYLVEFLAADCPIGSHVSVQAHKGGSDGVNSGTVSAVTTRLNVAIVDVNVVLPEMGTIVGGIAALSAGGAFLVIRRKQNVA